MPSERIPREAIAARLAEVGYVADRDLATALWMMDYLKRPLLIEGEAGVGKTEVAKALAALHGCELIRMQCYEGLDASSALYEWNYQRQLLAIKAREGGGSSASEIEAQIFSEDYLLERPLLKAIRRKTSPVLLVDEVDRADEEFEAFLLELLSDFQVTIPEFGTITALSIPRVVLTSNATRELSDALRRRCLYHYLDFPDVDREAAILLNRQPNLDANFAFQIARMVGMLRKEDLKKVPGVAETLDWAATLAGLEVKDLHDDPEIVHATLIALLKTREDRASISPETTSRLAWQGRVMGAQGFACRRTRTRSGDAQAPCRVCRHLARRRLRHRPSRSAGCGAADVEPDGRAARTPARRDANSVRFTPNGACAVRRAVRRVLARARREERREDQRRGARRPLAPAFRARPRRGRSATGADPYRRGRCSRRRSG